MKSYSLFHNLKRPKSAFNQLVAKCIYTNEHIKRLKVYKKISDKLIKLLKWFLLHFEATSYKKMRLSNVSLRHRSLFHNLKRGKCDFSEIVAIWIYILHFEAKCYKKMRLSNVSLRHPSLFHNFKWGKCDFIEIVAIWIYKKKLIKRPKVY